MNSELVLYLVKEALITGALVAAPVILAALITGFVISVLQVVTQIQDSTLTFIPKIVVVALIIALFGSWMLMRLVHFSGALITDIPTYLH